MTFQASLRMVSLSDSGGSAHARLRPRDPNNRCWRRDNSYYYYPQPPKYIHTLNTYCSCPLTFGKPASSQSLIIPMKSVALVATKSGLNALITEFSSKALWESNKKKKKCCFYHCSLTKYWNAEQTLCETFEKKKSTHLFPSFLHLSIISVSRGWSGNNSVKNRKIRRLTESECVSVRVVFFSPFITENMRVLYVPPELCRRYTAGSSWWRASKASGTLAPPPSAAPAGSGRSRCWSAGRCREGRRSYGLGCLLGWGLLPCPPRGRDRERLSMKAVTENEIQS